MAKRHHREPDPKAFFQLSHFSPHQCHKSLIALREDHLFFGSHEYTKGSVVERMFKSTLRMELHMEQDRPTIIFTLTHLVNFPGLSQRRIDLIQRALGLADAPATGYQYGFRTRVTLLEQAELA
jgi:hypothetical protein